MGNLGISKGKKIGIIVGVLAFGVMLGFSVQVSADSTKIPSWVKGVANFWVQGNISDSEFGEAITFLIKQGILKVEMPALTNDQSSLAVQIQKLEQENSQLKSEIKNLQTEYKKLKDELNSVKASPTSTQSSKSGFTDLICKQEYGIVKMSGRFTNDGRASQGILLKLIVLDSNRGIVATGIGSIPEIGPYETKYFDAVAVYDGRFASCDIQIELR